MSSPRKRGPIWPTGEHRHPEVRALASLEGCRCMRPRILRGSPQTRLAPQDDAISREARHLLGSLDPRLRGDDRREIVRERPQRDRAMSPLSWPGLSRPSRYSKRDAQFIGITGPLPGAEASPAGGASPIAIVIARSHSASSTRYGDEAIHLRLSTSHPDCFASLATTNTVTSEQPLQHFVMGIAIPAF